MKTTPLAAAAVLVALVLIFGGPDDAGPGSQELYTYDGADKAERNQLRLLPN